MLYTPICPKLHAYAGNNTYLTNVTIRKHFNPNPSIWYKNIFLHENTQMAYIKGSRKYSSVPEVGRGCVSTNIAANTPITPKIVPQHL